MVVIMKMMEVDAKLGRLNDIRFFLEAQLDTINCTSKCKMELLVAAEELFVNICNYAYVGKCGNLIVGIEVSRAYKEEYAREAVLEFRDWGIPFNPLELSNPDVRKKSVERSVGGLGVYLVKQSMDSLAYEYKDGQNILVLRKKLC